MNVNEIIKDLDAVQLIELKNYITNELLDICETKDSNSKIIENNTHNKICLCGCTMSKNGHTPTGVQKYVCSHCKHTCCATTNTVVYHSKLSFDIWKNVIDNLIDGFSIRRIAEENNISILTSFNLRHKVLRAIKKYIDNIKLSKSIQSDEKYFSINLKGTKPENMPRYSKKRTSTNSPYKGISHHKICVVTAIDEVDNIVMNIGGLGRGTTKMLEEQLGDKVENVDLITADSASAYQEFCKKHNIKLIAIPSGFHNDGINNLAEINGLHSQLEVWLTKFRGVSTRHLPDYLNWFNYIFTIKKRLDLKNIKTNSYKNIVVNENYIEIKSICNIPMPIDLNVAYAEYLHQ
ncbi:MAG: IS1595 family transposase [Bacilli bacterium]|nr:IS1595 family transposase [Erysipelotrichaceae bacterium]MDD5826960.1 IS1595 family transposase [Bacilli bacterium]